MSASHALVETPAANRYLSQLCKHWAHKFPVEQAEGRGSIDFGNARCGLTATDSALDVLITAPAEDLDRLERVVADHINRFAFREGELRFDWSRSSD